MTDQEDQELLHEVENAVYYYRPTTAREMGLIKSLVEEKYKSNLKLRCCMNCADGENTYDGYNCISSHMFECKSCYYHERKDAEQDYWREK